jgi:hypothetical protein
MALTVAPGRHAVLLLDQAGWQVSRKLVVPHTFRSRRYHRNVPNSTQSRMSGSSRRDNWLSNRVFRSYEDIVDHCCHAWNRLIDQPWTNMSIGLRAWAQFRSGSFGITASSRL